MIRYFTFSSSTCILSPSSGDLSTDSLPGLYRRKRLMMKLSSKRSPPLLNRNLDWKMLEVPLPFGNSNLIFFSTSKLGNLN